MIKEYRCPKTGVFVILDEVKWTNPRTNKTFICPAGFVTDYASTKIVKFDDAGQLAALFHDVAYFRQDVTRADADKEFLDNLLAVGVGKIKAYAYYFAVSLFAKKAWNENKSNKIKYGENHKILKENQLKKYTGC